MYATPSLARARNLGYADIRVFWLPYRPTLRAFPEKDLQWPITDFVHGYSCGAATAFHRLPRKSGIGQSVTMLSWRIGRGASPCQDLLRFSRKPSFICLNSQMKTVASEAEQIKHFRERFYNRSALTTALHQIVSHNHSECLSSD